MTDGAGVPTGTPLPDPPLVDAISEDPILRNTKLIAEAWDCDGLNQVWGGRIGVWTQCMNMPPTHLAGVWTQCMNMRPTQLAGGLNIEKLNSHWVSAKRLG